MKKKLFIHLSLLALLFSTIFGQTFGATRMSGVHEGDYFTYTMAAFWSTNNPSATVPQDLLTINSTSRYKVTISYVSGENVSTEDLWSFMNGTQTPSVTVQNVDSGASYLMKGLVTVAGADLRPDDLLYPSGDDPRRINETIGINYGSTKRDTNAVFFSYPVTDSSNNVIGYGNEVYYFDKATGMLVGSSDNSVTSGENVSITLLIADTNVWSITAVPKIVSPNSNTSTSELPQGSDTSSPIPILPITIAVVIVAALVPIVYYGTHRKRKRRSHR
jgi:hypothetical protein